MSQNNDFVTRMIQTQRLFKFDGGKCIYTNIQLIKKKEKNVQDSKIHITNKLCHQKGQQLIKITQIYLQDKIITIQDIYTLQSTSNKNHLFHNKTLSSTTTSYHGSNIIYQNNQLPIHYNHQKNKKKKLIFKKKNLFFNSHSHHQKRNTKNVAKNFCKAFLSYLAKQNQKVSLIKAKQLIAQFNYNNRVIQELAHDELVNNQFKDFLQNKAQQWIKSSKIIQKNIHSEAIALYIDLIKQYQLKKKQSSQLINQQQNCQNNSSNQLYHSSDNFNLKQNKQK